MGDRGMQFEERKQNFKPEGVEYSRGGGGDGSAGFFSMKSNVYSRHCYNDPENPGKIICKETRNQSGYDPFTKEGNYRNVKEKVYSHDIPGYNKNLNENNGNLENSDPKTNNSIFTTM